jgi:hypothetical protein
MTKSCRQCAQQFEIRNEDLAFYDKFSPVFNGKKCLMPPPTLCPACRRQRRHAFRNERNLYNRKCSLTGKNIVSAYSDEVPFPVYDHEIWYGDGWDAMKYGQDYNPARPFFDQYKELYGVVPRINFMNQASENSDYTNYAYRNKNCYLVFGSHYNEDCLYANYAWKDVNCVDCTEVIQSELVYEGIYSDGCYRCAFIEYGFNCSDCYFCYDMIGCKNCVFSSNLRNKEYYVFNKPLTKEAYQEFFKKMELSSYSGLQKLYAQYMDVRAKAIKRDMFQKNCENCLGSDIQNSKNVYMGFNAKFIEDCAYVDTQATHVKDSMDLTCIGYDPSELLYECVGNSGNTNAKFCNSCWHNSNTSYCEQCFDSSDLFGCVGLNHKQYCILNRQYSKDEYEKLVPEIIEKMRLDGEWGEFYPSSLSPFGYNETVAQIYTPLTEKAAVAKGFKWKKKEDREYRKQTFQIPDLLKDVTESITNEILACGDCGKNFKIVPMELKFYRQMGLAVPRICPDCRNQKRISLKTPTRLWARKCAKCGAGIMTAYAPERTETVYCESCYLKEVY